MGPTLESEVKLIKQLTVVYVNVRVGNEYRDGFGAHHGRDWGCAARDPHKMS